MVTDVSMLQSVSYKADNNRVRLDLDEVKETQKEDKSDNEEYIEELEEKLEELKKKHSTTVMKMQREHQKEVQRVTLVQEKGHGLRVEVDLFAIQGI